MPRACRYLGVLGLSALALAFSSCAGRGVSVGIGVMGIAPAATTSGAPDGFCQTPADCPRDYLCGADRVCYGPIGGAVWSPNAPVEEDSD